MAKSYEVKLKRTIVEMTTIVVRASDKRSAAFAAAGEVKDDHEWNHLETTVKVGEIAEAE